GGREAVGDVFEPEGGEAVEGVRAAGLEEAVVVVVCVDEGDVEALRVEELGQFQHRVHVALCWERYANCVRLFLQGN
ncbi:hypothetical protein TIFTF001_055629, partial [Ficus carica]